MGSQESCLWARCCGCPVHLICLPRTFESTHIKIVSALPVQCVSRELRLK